MRMDNIKTPVVFILIISLAITQNVYGTSKLDISEKDAASSENLPTEEPVTRDKIETVVTLQAPETDKRKLTDKYSSNGLSSTGELARQKRSMLSEQGYGSTLREEINALDRLRELQRMKRFFSDYGYGSRLQAGENLANSLTHGGLFSLEGPGKRSAETAEFDVFNDDTEKDKRINTDYGYGSRVQAAENVAMDWDRNGLFGVMGPGKRSDIDHILNSDTSKRIATDFGYGSRFNAAKNAAMTTQDGLFGRHGPGKRSKEQALRRHELTKRIMSDYGYGSRMQAAENAAQSSSRGGLFGIQGPGKRNTQGTEMFANLPDQENLPKRIDSDFGYGSREQAAENLAKSVGKTKIFGIYGPGKRSRVDFERNIRDGETMEADSGYGSRIQAGSQIAKDVVAINDLFGSFGPGRRKRTMEFPEGSSDTRIRTLIRKYLSKRSEMPVDVGYGSRIKTAARLARSNSVKDIFGSEGPGK